MIKTLVKAGAKLMTAGKAKGNKDFKSAEKALNGANNSARGQKWSADEARGYSIYNQMNPKATPESFNALPKAERRQYVEMGKTLGQSEQKSGPGKAMASVGDAFTASTELKSEGKKGGGISNLIGGLAEAFA